MKKGDEWRHLKITQTNTGKRFSSDFRTNCFPRRCMSWTLEAEMNKRKFTNARKYFHFCCYEQAERNVRRNGFKQTKWFFSDFCWFSGCTVIYGFERRKKFETLRASEKKNFRLRFIQFICLIATGISSWAIPFGYFTFIKFIILVEAISAAWLVPTTRPSSI